MNLARCSEAFDYLVTKYVNYLALKRKQSLTCRVKSAQEALCWNNAADESGEDLPEEAVEPPRPEKGYRENDDRGDDILHERVDQRHRRQHELAA